MSGLSQADYSQADAVGLAALIRSGEISAAEALEAAIARADQVNPALNAVVMRHDELARAQIRGGLPPDAPLAGVPMLLKDLNLYLKGTITSQGSRFFLDSVADRDSTLVARYRAAGMVIFGKTASPELGATPTTESLAWGKTRNPWNLEHSSGGSSGGAAVAVAAGIVPIAHASDGGGSIRIPATHCGLFGLKPSRGLVPAGPDSIENWGGLSVNHAVTRTVRDSAALLDISAGPEPGSRAYPSASSSYLAALDTPAPRLRIALMETNPLGVPVHPECLAALAKTAALCEALGHQVEPASPVLPAQAMMTGMGAITGAGALAMIRDRERVLGRAVTEADLEPINLQNFRNAQKLTAEDLHRGRATADQVGRIFDEFLTRYDLILSPVTAVPPPRLGALALDQPYESFVENAVKGSCFTIPYNVAGLPAMSVPLHWTADGLPVGSMFGGRYGDEATLLRLAAQLEQAAPWRDRRPAL